MMLCQNAGHFSLEASFLIMSHNANNQKNVIVVDLLIFTDYEPIII